MAARITRSWGGAFTVILRKHHTAWRLIDTQFARSSWRGHSASDFARVSERLENEGRMLEAFLMLDAAWMVAGKGRSINTLQQQAWLVRHRALRAKVEASMPITLGGKAFTLRPHVVGYESDLVPLFDCSVAKPAPARDAKLIGAHVRAKLPVLRQYFHRLEVGPPPMGSHGLPSARIGEPL